MHLTSSYTQSLSWGRRVDIDNMTDHQTSRFYIFYKTLLDTSGIVIVNCSSKLHAYFCRWAQGTSFFTSTFISYKIGIYFLKAWNLSNFALNSRVSVSDKNSRGWGVNPRRQHKQAAVESEYTLIVGNATRCSVYQLLNSSRVWTVRLLLRYAISMTCWTCVWCLLIPDWLNNHALWHVRIWGFAGSDAPNDFLLLKI